MIMEIKNVNSEDVDSQSMPARDQGQRVETCCAKRRRSNKYRVQIVVICLKKRYGKRK